MADATLTYIDEKVKARFWAKVNVHAPNECWEWQGTRRGGYGVFTVFQRRYVASRFALALHISRDLTNHELACHTCDNPSCCNPAHLFLGTQRENMQDAAKKGRTHKWNGSRRGEANQRAKLTEQAVLDIRDSNEIRTVLARRYGVAPCTISKVRHRRSWL